MKSGRVKLGLFLAALAAAGFGALALGRLEEPPRKWIVMGWDGASWDNAFPLLEAGRLPHLARLMREGSYGDLSTFKPAESAAVWTTVATGVSPSRHRILGFTRPATGARAWLPGFLSRGPLRPGLYSNADRRRKALWNIASDAGRRVMVVGYHTRSRRRRFRGSCCRTISCGSRCWMRSRPRRDGRWSPARGGTSCIRPRPSTTSCPWPGASRTWAGTKRGASPPSTKSVSMG